jgi:putative sterol carrier protein
MSLRSEAAFRSFVARSDDRRLDRLAGSRMAQRMVFAQLVRRFDPAGAGGFNGELQFDLRGAGERVNVWTVEVTDHIAIARFGPAARYADVTVAARAADVLRMAAGELGPGRALLDGRLDLAGDWSVAMRLGKMFGAG